MTDDKVTKLDDVRKAFEKAEPREKTEKPKAEQTKKGGGGGKPPGPPRDWRPPPLRLPPDAPVKALGYNGLSYHFLAKSGQRITLAAKEISRNNILAVFGGEEYLVEHWPSYNKDGEPTGEFKHGRLSPVLISTCQDMGLWDPADKERGVGCWAEEDGTLVFHCGDILSTSKGRDGTGLRGRLLYPSAPALPEPIVKALPSPGAALATVGWHAREWAEVDGPGARVMELLTTWNYERPYIDAILITGWLGSALLGAAPDWRPMGCLTGDTSTGKSTLLRGLKWIIGREAYVSSGNGTQAAIARLVGSSSKPVLLDELERNEDNRQVQKLIELMVLASSGETLDRGTPGPETNSFVARNCFLISAVVTPPLRPQDINRLAIIELQPLEGFQPDKADEDDGDEGGEQNDHILGPRSVLEKIGRELRGRLLQGWPRYYKTFRRFHRELLKNGHKSRGADQFGALLTAYDLIMFNDFDQARAEKLAALLPARTMAETSGRTSNHEACLQHLLSFTPMIIRGGSNETIAHWLRRAKEAVSAQKDEDLDEALRALAKTGIKVFRDRRHAAGHNEDAHWTVALSNEADGMARVFANTKWNKTSGSTAGWPQMFKRLSGAETHNAKTGDKLRIRIDKVRHYVTFVPWTTLFPPFDNAEDADDVEAMTIAERGV